MTSSTHFNPLTRTSLKRTLSQIKKSTIIICTKQSKWIHKTVHCQKYTQQIVGMGSRQPDLTSQNLDFANNAYVFYPGDN